MEYAYAALILHETGEEINETNLKTVVSAADGDVIESRTKAFVAALEDVDLDRVAEGDASLSVRDVSSNGHVAGSPESDDRSSTGNGSADRPLKGESDDAANGDRGTLSGLLDPLLGSAPGANGTTEGTEPSGTDGDGEAQPVDSGTEDGESAADSRTSTERGGTETDSAAGGS